MKASALKMLLALGSLFAPTKPILIAIMVLSMIDLLTGILSAHKRKEPITSSGLKRTVLKIAVYQFAVLTAYLVQLYLTGPDLPVMNMVASLIGITELKSVLENLDIVLGESAFGAVVSKLNDLMSLKPPSE